MNRSTTLLTASMLVAFLTQPQNNFGQEQLWNNAVGGDFSNAANWDADVPNETEDARFDLDATYGINLTGDHTIAGFFQERGQITLSGGFALNVLQPSDIYDGTLNLSGAGTQIDQAGEFAIGRDGGNANFNVLSGATLSTEVGRLGYTNDATGTATIDGTGSQWLLDTTLIVGRAGAGNLTIQNGGQVASGRSLTVGMTGTTGSVLVTGDGSSFVSALNTSQVGSNGTGTFNIENAGEATFASLIVGNGASGNGSVLVDGIGSTWNVTGSTTVGGSGSGNVEIRNGGSAAAGSILTLGTSANGAGTVNVNSGGTLLSRLTRIGHVSGSQGEVHISGANSQWNVTNQMFVGSSGVGSVSISAGGQSSVSDFIRVGFGTDATGALTVTGVGSELTSSGLDVGYQGTATMTIADRAVVTDNFANIGRLSGSNGTVLVDGSGTSWNSGTSLDIGAAGTGSLTVSGGGIVSTSEANVAQSPGSNGTLNVTGNGSQFLSDSFVVGGADVGVVAVELGGVMNNTGFGSVGTNGSAVLRNTGSQWNNDGNVNIGGSLIVESGGTFTSGRTYLGPTGTNGSVVVRGTGSSWTSEQALVIGRFGSGSLEVSEGGLVSNQLTSIGASGGVGSLSVQGNGSRLVTTNFEIGFDGDGSGVVSAGGHVQAGSVFLMSDGMGSQSEFTVTGQGSLLTGTGNLRIGDGNSRTGSLFVLDGGSVSIDGTTTISEFGTLTLDQGELVNANQAINWGEVQVIGDSVLTGGFELKGNGRFETSNNSLAIVNGDVDHNGLEIFTAQGSQIRFSDHVAGAGSFTGTGEVQFAGQFAPGNSPAIIDFDGDVAFLNNSLLSIELGTTNLGDFDQLLIDGGLSLDGGLSVNLVGGLELTAGMEFLVADIGGVLTGQFDGLGEGALVGNFGDTGLFISYASGNGNDISLFTGASVPEPSGIMILVVAGLVGLGRRRRV